MSDPSPQASSPDHDELVVELAGFPAELDRMLHGISNEALSRPASGGGWGVVEILCHLLDWDRIFLQRLEAVVAEENPDLPAFDGALWEIEHDYRSQDPREAQLRLGEARGRFAEILSSLDEADWNRVGNHSLRGPVTVEWLAIQLRDHSREHVQQIRDALA